jgi:hypothetical protein
MGTTVEDSVRMKSMGLNVQAAEDSKVSERVRIKCFPMLKF